MSRFPFGRVSEIRADDRGWVFLERFISSVKCAMLREDAAEYVILSNSSHIAAQIKTSAAHLRKAARGDGPATEVSLKKVFQEQTKLLDNKRFSAASTDKIFYRGNAKPQCGSRDREGLDGRVRASLR